MSTRDRVRSRPPEAPGRGPRRRSLLLAVVGVVALVGPAACAGAVHAGSPNALTWYATSMKNRAGCATVGHSPTQFNATGGTLRAQAAAAASTCKPLSGGKTTESMARYSAGITVLEPVRLASRNHGISVTWIVSASLSTSASSRRGPAGCPVQVNQTHVNYGYTWVNTTTWDQNCFVLANSSAWGSAYLEDRTTGSRIGPSGAWSGVSNISGFRVVDSGFSVHYSNRSYWGSNYSSMTSSNRTWGGTGLLNVSVRATWWFNASFVATDRYLLVSSFFYLVLAECLDLRGAHASSGVDLRSPGLGAHVLPPVRY